MPLCHLYISILHLYSIYLIQLKLIITVHKASLREHRHQFRASASWRC